MSYGLRVRLRQEMGQDIAAACGQLALVSKEKGTGARGGGAGGGTAATFDIEELGSKTAGLSYAPGGAGKCGGDGGGNGGDEVVLRRGVKTGVGRDRVRTRKGEAQQENGGEAGTMAEARDDGDRGKKAGGYPGEGERGNGSSGRGADKGLAAFIAGDPFVRVAFAVFSVALVWSLVAPQRRR